MRKKVLIHSHPLCLSPANRGNEDPQRSPAGRQIFPDEDRNSMTPLNSCGTEAQVFLSSQKNRFLRILRVPWTARPNQLILKEINPESSLEGLMLKLKLQYFGHLMRRTDSLEKTLMVGNIEGRRRRRQRMR